MIEKCLTISTAHMPDDDPDFAKLRVAAHQYGFIVFVASLDNLRPYVPTWLEPLYRKALEFECTLIMFDSDAAADEEFENYEW